MKRINLLYLAIIPLGYFIYQMNNQLSQSSAFFYGFAENKETELSHDQDVLVSKIMVTPGQEVSKGQLLMEVKQSAIDFKLGKVDLDLERVAVQSGQRRQEIKDRIQQLQTKKLTNISEIESEIRALEATVEYTKDLMNDLKSIEPVNGTTAPKSPNELNIEALKEQLRVTTDPINVEIGQLQKELSATVTPAWVQKKILEGEKEYYKQEQDKLVIIAPSDGLIGNVLCKEGENISAFSTLINFYERNPTLVKGFVHESLILQVELNDTLFVSSSLHVEHKIQGQVIGLGTRIVEIPERLRKMPEIKTYGREVLIRIPAMNPFLQKEKVMLNSEAGEDQNSLGLVLSFLFPREKKTKSSNRTTSYSQ